MTDMQKEIASVEEFEKTLTFESPIPVSWAVRKYKALHELKERLEKEMTTLVAWHNRESKRQAEEIKQLKDQRNRALAEWGKMIETSEILAEALKLIKFSPSSHSYSRAIADDVLTRLGEPK